MKRIKLLSLMLALVMLLSMFMTGCNKEDGGKTEPTTPEGVDPNLSLGIIEDYTYTNKYMGIALTLDESWTLSSAKELQDLPDAVEGMVEGTLVGEAMKNVTYYMDMQATTTSGDNIYSINVVMEQLTAVKKNMYKNMTNEDILDATLQAKDLMIQSYEAMGMRNIEMEKTQAQYLGKTCAVLKTTATLYNQPYTILQVLDYTLGEYSGTLTVACMGEDNTAELLAMFTAI